MTSLSSKYNPAEVEDKWYEQWMEKGFFHSEPNPDKEPYSIVIPPPNVTGVLHMGHMLNNTIQDILIRKARMEGKEACWVPGTDHASIATEAKVVAMLKEQGIDKNDITREQFMDHAFEWKEKYGGIILEQLKKLGASCDWERTRFTMEDDMSEAVIEVFCDLFEKGLIYRGVRMVNWDPAGQTALSDDEVIHKDINSKLYHLKYQIEGEDEFVVIATTRPETILGDTAICINPNDKRHTSLKGKKVIVPLINRVIPIIEDDYVSMEFGTGCLKVTPAHDIHDYELGLKHKLESIDILNDDGTLSEAAQLYVGKDRFVVRDEIVKDLEAKGQVEKIEDYKNSVGFSERTDAVIEPKLSTQWFLNMEDITKPALKNVMDDTIQFYPSKFKNMYSSWMDNIRDWCISRQLWWGQQIPAYYLENGDFVVAMTPEEALAKAKIKLGDDTLTMKDLKQDEDVLDTWFSSWLWPISVFNGFKNKDNKDINYYYPTSVLVTGWDIIFFWVARMIIAGYEFKDEFPFKEVYFTGMVRDEKRRKMSKSLGNSPEPLKLIKKFGADGVRTGMLFSAAAGNDLLFDEKLCEQGRNFSNKIWNAFRLVKGWEVKEGSSSEASKAGIAWFESTSNKALAEIEDHFSKYRISDALMAVYKLTKDDFCSWYLEIVKPGYEQPIDSETYNATINFFEKLIKILHPFMPFITEEIWHSIKERQGNDYLIVAEYPKVSSFDKAILEEGEIVFESISNIRNIRISKQMSPKAVLDLFIQTNNPAPYTSFKEIIKKLAFIEKMEFVNDDVSGAANFMVGTDKLYLPIEENIDVEAELKKLKEELKYTQGFLNTVMKKLSNERFVDNAPEQVVVIEKKKQADAEAKIKTLEESIASLS